MTYLVDTHWVASFLNGRAEARQLFQTLTFPASAISLVTYGEIYEGIYYGRTPQHSERSFQQLLRALTVLPLNRAIFRQFARIRGDLRRLEVIYAGVGRSSAFRHHDCSDGASP